MHFLGLAGIPNYPDAFSTWNSFASFGLHFYLFFRYRRAMAAY